MAILVKRNGSWAGENGGINGQAHVKYGGSFGSRIKKGYVKRNGYWVDSGYVAKPLPATYLSFAYSEGPLVWIIANAPDEPASEWDTFRVYLGRNSEGVVWYEDFGHDFYYAPFICKQTQWSSGMYFDLRNYGGINNVYIWYIVMYHQGVWSDPSNAIVFAYT